MGIDRALELALRAVSIIHRCRMPCNYGVVPLYLVGDPGMQKSAAKLHGAVSKVRATGAGWPNSGCPP